MTRIKCNSCDIIINKRQSFSEDDITEAKSLLFESVQQRKIKRRGDAGKNKIIEDIIGLLKEADPEIFATFVARDIQKLPPNLTFDLIEMRRAYCRYASYAEGDQCHK
ncbi:unnamed protein product [Euphydryas editha]|uniref:Uncharacterized protein n=1 Tax=Euphydryas editha TaxID=104508 RepID=A0AAU9TRA7_EUPED|nr:unnamed protein product [Euphydryas editha]